LGLRERKEAPVMRNRAALAPHLRPRGVGIRMYNRL